MDEKIVPPLVLESMTEEGLGPIYKNLKPVRCTRKTVTSFDNYVSVMGEGFDH